MPALVKIMTWRLSGDKPLSEPMMVRLLMHICVTRLQWVKEQTKFLYVVRSSSSLVERGLNDDQMWAWSKWRQIYLLVISRIGNLEIYIYIFIYPTNIPNRFKKVVNLFKNDGCIKLFLLCLSVLTVNIISSNIEVFTYFIWCQTRQSVASSKPKASLYSRTIIKKT